MKNQKIVDNYLARFDLPKIGFNKFFTQYSNEDFVENLPFVPDVEKFCVRLAEALEKKQKICIYADYDTDAVTATACMYWGLIYLGFDKQNLGFYAPDRFTEGYGVNPQAIEKLAKENDLIITVDCGINSVEEAKIVKKLGKDILITDHHSLTGLVPPADGVVNPRLNEHYLEQCHLDHSGDIPSKIKNKKYQNFLNRFYKIQEERFAKNTEISSQTHLSSSVVGAGVSWFAVLWLGYFLQSENLAPKDFNIKLLNKTLVFAAIGTVADLQSILEPTNRLIVKSGLQLLNSSKTGFLGLDFLTQDLGFVEKIQAGYKLTSQDLAFYYSPLLNSSGRISHANLSIGLMLAEQSNQAREFSSELIATNQERKQMVRDILEEVEDEAKKQFENKESLIFVKGQWNKGIVGLLASRLVNKYNLPVVVAFEEEGKMGGSARAPEGYNLPEAFGLVKDFFEKFGGHPGAAGFELKANKSIQNLKSKLQNIFLEQSLNCKKNVTSFAPRDFEDLSYLGDEMGRKENIWLDKKDLDNSLYEMIIKLDPFGRDFPMPEFIFKVDNYETRFLGQENKHIKIFFDNKSVTIFNLESREKNFFENERGELWIKAKISQNTWNNKTNLELLASKIWIDE